MYQETIARVFGISLHFSHIFKCLEGLYKHFPIHAAANKPGYHVSKSSTVLGFCEERIYIFSLIEWVDNNHIKGYFQKSIEVQLCNPLRTNKNRISSLFLGFISSWLASSKFSIATKLRSRSNESWGICAHRRINP